MKDAETELDDSGGQAPLLLPDDAHNRRLTEHVHPSTWTNPVPNGRYNLVVIGGGTAGLICAIGAAGMGGKVALIERHMLGGDCLNFGCVPSKSIIRAARAVAEVRRAGQLGVHTSPPKIDFSAIMERMRRQRAEISHHDSAQRFKDLGVDVYLGEARFFSEREVDVDGVRLRFAKAAIATGARARAPEVPGLVDAGYLTNETIFALTELPRRLAVVGAGPIGAELAQAFARFGSEVTLIGRNKTILPKEDSRASDVLASCFQEEGIRVLTGAELKRVSVVDGAKHLSVEVEGVSQSIQADEILLSVGRVPNTENMGLEAAGVAFDKRGVTVNDRMQTSNKHIYAAGDVCSGYKFTHAADAMARIVIQNALFLGRKKASSLVIPWATYTSPEIAHVGISQDEAEKQGALTLTVQFDAMDRARLDDDMEGFASVHVDAKTGRILGATAVAGHAGDLIAEMSLAMTADISLGTIAKTIHPYPTQSEVWKRLADAWNRTRLTPRVQSLSKRWLAWRR